ncbi:MAG: hypothetical protein JST39_11855, partial [Bacteroidetes bacterium]|nr:hypothetical protein [Bacteroidota bacterium]
MYTYDASAPAGSPTNPNVPTAGIIGKWIRSPKNNYWDVSRFKCYIYNNMAFRLRYPNNYDTTGNTKYPVLIFLHGGGEIGPLTENEAQLYWGARMFEERINNGEWNGFMLFPQQQSIGWDPSYFDRINDILDTLQHYNYADPDRNIAIGLSSGGYGVISYGQLYPKRIATVIAASPAYVNTLNHDLGNFIHIPVWMANGGADANPHPSQASVFANAFIAAGGNIYQTYLAEADHITWSWQWELTGPGSHILLDDWWNNAHKAQPLVYYSNDHFCNGAVNARLGITAGFAAYEWQADRGAGFTTIAGATGNEYQATQAGKYRVRFQRSPLSGWSDWTPNPVVISEKSCTTDTLFAEHFEEANPYFYASASYKPNTWDCTNGIVASSCYNLTQDATGRTGGRFLQNNTGNNGGCTYSGNDEVWHGLNPVTVTPNTTYEYTFYLANRSNTNYARIMPAINGVALAPNPVQATGDGDRSWTKFSFTWNSGSATTADLSLLNTDTSTNGNDFAIDEISLALPAGAAPANKKPVANAGPDTTITLPVNSLVLNGSASSDSDGHIVKYAWTKVSGPANATFTRTDSSFAPVSNLDSGVYVFSLAVTDDKGATAADTVIVTVHPPLVIVPPVNKIPIANAGQDITITLPVNSVVLNGSASSDLDGHIVQYAWTRISGPANYSFTRTDSSFAPVSGLEAGVYVFHLVVTDDKGATAADDVTVTVNPAIITPPVVQCGPLPAGVSTTDVLSKNWYLSNNGITPGNACFIAPGTYKVNGAGDLAKQADKFRYVYKTMEGNGTVTVRVTSQDAVSPLNRAGIMLRETLVSGSDYVSLTLSSGSGVYFQTQTHAGLTLDADNSGAGMIKAPYYLRLVRTGSNFTAWISKDSISWTSLGKKTIPAINKTLYVGLVVSSSSNTILSEAFFDNWTITDKTNNGNGNG